MTDSVWARFTAAHKATSTNANDIARLVDEHFVVRPDTLKAPATQPRPTSPIGVSIHVAAELNSPNNPSTMKRAPANEVLLIRVLEKIFTPALPGHHRADATWSAHPELR